MTRKTVNGWVIVASLILLVVMGLLFPLAAAAVPYKALQSPEPSVSPESELESPSPAPIVASPSPTVTLEASPSPTVTLEASPSPTLTLEVSPSPTVTLEASPSPTATLEVLPSPTTTTVVPPSPMPTFTPRVPPTPEVTPTSELPFPISWLPPDVGQLLIDYQILAIPICLVLPLLLLALLLIFLIMRRRRRPPTPTAPLSPPAPLAPYLQSVAASGARRFALRPEGVAIGRSAENDLVITEDMTGWQTVSQQHARIYKQAERWIIEDLQSTNGVYVNGKRTGRNTLRDGWRVGIGGVEFDFHAGTGEATR